MKRALLFGLIFSLLQLFAHTKTNAQSFELIGGNILNGALTGTILGTSTMGLQNSSDFTPFRIGLGSGILGGTGIAIYDIATLPRGHEFFISGTFNDGSNTSIIILLDTVYGATVGAALGTAVSLIGGKSFVKGVQYGASAGAWAGFGFGLVDAFMIAERNRDFISDNLFESDSLFAFKTQDTHFKFIQPDLYVFSDLSGSELNLRFEPAVNLFSFQKTF